MTRSTTLGWVLLAYLVASLHADTILDTLGTATPASAFSSTGATAIGIGSFGGAGPLITITQPTIITEVGAFLNIDFICVCEPNPILGVVFWPSENGVPALIVDPLPPGFVLSNDRDDSRFSYEVALIRHLLTPGEYFVLFEASPRTGFGILQSAPGYQAESALFGEVNFLFQSSQASEQPGAVRVLGEPVPEPASVLFVSIGVITMLCLRRKPRRFGKARNWWNCCAVSRRRFAERTDRNGSSRGTMTPAT